MASSSPKSADDWLAAAYARFATEGLSGIRVEVVARDLATTKGSFYWHYADRRALVEAVMTRWEHDETDSLIEIAEGGGSPGERLTLLYRAVGQTASRRRGETRLYVEASADGVAEYVTRVSHRRIDYIASILEAAGIAPDEARRRATISLATALGFEQLSVAGALSVNDSEGLTESAVRMALGEPS